MEKFRIKKFKIMELYAMNTRGCIKDRGNIMKFIKQVLCEVSGNVYGINIEHVQAIEKNLEIVPVPNAMQLVEGIANLRGNVIPVFSLHQKFNAKIPENAAEITYIIVKIDELSIALHVDAVAEIVELPEEAFLQVPTIVDTDETSYIDSVIRVNNKLVLVLDVDGVLTEKEKEKVSKLIEEQ